MATGKKTGGRQKGSLNKRTKSLGDAAAAVVQQISDAIPDAFAGDAHAFMMMVYKNPENDTALRLDAAKAAIRFEKASLSAIEHTGKDGDALIPAATDERELAKAIVAALAGAAKAEPETPAE